MLRREFLRIAGAGGAAVALAPAWPAQALIGTASARVRYGAAWSDGDCDAAALQRGDPALARSGVRLTVFGLAPEHASWSGRISLAVLFPQPAAPVRFQAWSHDGSRPGGAGRANSFVVPLDDLGRLRLEIRSDGRAFPVELRTGSERAAPKLLPGIYRMSGSGTPPLIVTVDPAESGARSRAPWRTEHV